MNKKQIFIIASLLAITSVNQVDAACTQTNLAGLWQDFALAYNAGSVAKCTFHIDKYGNILSESVCYNYTGTTDMPPIYITSGNFSVNKICAISGTLGADNGISAFFKGQMDRSKTSFSGISRNSSGNIALHNFVKQ
jgi:hypothetical protein